MVSRRIRAVGTVAALAVAAAGFTLLPGAAPQAAATALVPYSSCEELVEYYRSALERSIAAGARRGLPMPVPLDAQSSAGRAEAAQSGSAPAADRQSLDAVGAGPTGTNVQERGVDEPDLAKTVGNLLFAFSEDGLQIVRNGPQPQLLSSFALGGSAYGAELLVQGDRVLVLMPASGSAGPGIPEPMAPPGQAPPTGKGTSPAPPPDAPTSGIAAPSQSSPIAPDGGPFGPGSTRLILVDVQDPTAPRLVETLEITGRYLSARLSGGTVRLVTASTPSLPDRPTTSPYGPAEERAARTARRDAARSATVEQVLPHEVRRSATGALVAEGPAVPCAQVRHASAPTGAGTLLVTTLDPGKGLGATDRTAVTTEGDLVYASAERLYVATSRWGTAAPTGGTDIARPDRSEKVTTELHAFDTTSATTTAYAGSASVPGYVYGRWALSSHAGHLRVATTSAAPWSGGEGLSSASTVTVLQEKADGLVETGKVEGLGKGERIYAVRYFGDLATVVTFRQTDPLYVLDLADPRSPRLLGELKVPGFSTYLHPVGGDRLLGIGSDADSNGRVTGMQVSLFDLSDRSKPVQLDRMSLGQGHSLAMDDSRAFGYDPQRRLALLPLSTYDMSSDGRSGGSNDAVGIRVTEDGALEPAGRLRLGPQVQVERVLHDSTSVYAVSRTGVVAGRVGDLGRTGSVDFSR